MREFKYYPEDFGDLTVKVRHMELHFAVFEDHTVVSSRLDLTALVDLTALDLNARGLEILEVSEPFDYLESEHILRLNFAREIAKGTDFSVATKTICRPTAHDLEGLYYDETPAGCPRQQITQCQQWGFQRIVPCIDDMTAKCTYRTTIEADYRYTNYLSNGDLVAGPEPLGEGRVRVVYDNLVTPMATYLFFLGVGTYETFKRQLMYPDGDAFELELLVPPGSDAEAAEHALDVLADSILYVHLFTGPNKYENWAAAMEIYKLMQDREANLARISELYAGGHWGYRYTGTVYREIGMQNSNFGGMENVGNTTITTNRIMPFKEMTDGGFEYMILVKVHEFYHNLNGSEVTGRSPFEIWLNEAVTVFIEKEYHNFLFGENYGRMGEVLTFMAPGGGTFAMDDQAAAMPIEPDGFNDPNELITGVTYVKAPEFVRMIETLMGKESFVKGLDLYHRRYKHSNASRAQWVEAMEEACGMNFQRMAEVWLKQASYPKIAVKSRYEGGNFYLDLEQSGFEAGKHWEFPFAVALCDEEGAVLAEQCFHVKEARAELVFRDVAEPAFASLNRGFSVFGKVNYAQDSEELYLQVRKDGDCAARFVAFNKLAEAEKMRLLEDPAAKVDEQFVDLYFELLNDKALMAELAGNFLVMFDQVEDERFAHDYEALYQAGRRVRVAIAEKYRGELIALYKGLAGEGGGEHEGYVQQKVRAIKARQVKNICLGLLAKLDDEEVLGLVRTQLAAAEVATDKVVALRLYLESAAADKYAVLTAEMEAAARSLVSWESFLAVVARADSDDCVEMLKEVEASPHFRVEQANEQRAFYAAFAGNRRLSLQQEEGRIFLADSLRKLAPLNEYSAGYLLKVFGNLKDMPEKDQAPLRAILEGLRTELSQEKVPSVYNTLERILKSLG